MGTSIDNIYWQLNDKFGSTVDHIFDNELMLSRVLADILQASVIRELAVDLDLREKATRYALFRDLLYCQSIDAICLFELYHFHPLVHNVHGDFQLISLH